jgi:hypothetical protein
MRFSNSKFMSLTKRINKSTIFFSNSLRIERKKGYIPRHKHKRFKPLMVLNYQCLGEIFNGGKR